VSEEPASSPASQPGGFSIDGPPAERPDVYVARMGDRILARLIDGLVFVVPFVVLVFVVGRPKAVEDAAGEPTGIEVAHWTLLFGLLMVGSAVYEIALTALTGQTLGKRFRHIRVVHLADSSVPGWGTSLARWVTMNAASLLSFVVTVPASGLYGIVDLGLGFRRPLHQCLHDMTAKTVVISDR